MNTQEALLIQQANITRAIELLQGSVDKLTSQVNPDAATWADVGRFAHVAEPASAVATARESYGEVQGIVHAFFKEASPPYLKVRELSTQHLVNCYFRSEMYQAAVDVLADPSAVVLVEGWAKEDADSGWVTELR